MVDQHDDMSRYTEAQPRPQESFSKRHEKLIRRGVASLAIYAAFWGVGAQESQAQDNEELGTNPGTVLDVGSVSDFDRSRLAEAGLEIADAALQQTPEFPEGSQYATANPQEGYNSVNIRADQSVNSSIVMTIPRGERIVVDLPELDIDPNDGWYVAYDESGARLGYVHNSVIRIENGEIPPTPGFEIGPTPVQEAPPNTELNENPNVTETADTELETGAAPTTIPEVINPTYTPVLAPTVPENVIDMAYDPEYTRNFIQEVRQAEERLLEEMNLEPLPASQVSWITWEGEEVPMGLLPDFYIVEQARYWQNYVPFMGILRGVREFQAGGRPMMMIVVDVNDNRIVFTETMTEGQSPALMVMPHGGDLNDAVFQQVDRAGFYQRLRNTPINQAIIFTGYPSTYVSDSFSRAWAGLERNALVELENALENNTPITNTEAGLYFSSIQGVVLQNNQ